MITQLIGDLREGRLARLPYLGYSILLLILMFVFVLGTVSAIGIGEHVLGGDLELAQEKLFDWFSGPAAIVFFLCWLFFLFAGLNIMAKRIRDIGLPGWWTVLALVLLTGASYAVVSENTGSTLDLLIWIALLVIPSNSFGAVTDRR